MVRSYGRPGDALDTAIDVETPERVRFSFRLAGPAQRAAAYLVDVLVRGAVLMGIWMIAGAFGVVVNEDGVGGAGVGIFLLALFVVEWGYYVACERWMNGRSVGKRVLHLRVVRSDGLPIGFSESVLRNLLRAADFLPFGYGLGVLVAAIDPRFRRLGDLAASTMVVVERAQPVLPAVEIKPAVQSRELEAIPLRPALNQEELEAIELFLRRMGELNVSREQELAELVAPVFARRMQLGYRNAARLLALLYHRARGSTA
jgi:uncharacterized RDD family membrane protein YckC